MVCNKSDRKIVILLLEELVKEQIVIDDKIYQAVFEEVENRA